MPKVSVIVPAYNRSALIAECIQSVLDQTYTDWELIVVDDGSTDDTASVVRRFGDRVTLLRQANAGACAARNAGFQASTGDLVSFLDSDDTMLPGNLATLVAQLDARPDADVAYGWYYWTDAAGFFNDLQQPIFEGRVLPQLVLDEVIMMGTALVRRARVAEIGGFDVSVGFMEHWDFFLRLARIGCLFTCCRSPVALLRLHDDNRGKDTDAMLAGRLATVKRFVNAAPDPLGKAAFSNTYAEYAQIYFRKDDHEKSAMCVNHLFEFGPQPAKLVEKIAAVAAHHALESAGADPFAPVTAMFRHVHPSADARRLQSIIRSRIHLVLAFRSQKRANRGEVRHHVLNAFRADTTLLRNRGLLRLAAESMGGATFTQWLRNRGRHSIDLNPRHLARTCLFISPHFDDVALSCGGTLAHVTSNGARALMITVFTTGAQEGQPLSLLARQLHKMWGSAGDPYAQRRIEDSAAAEIVGAQTLWLGFSDAAYRQQDLLHPDELRNGRYEPRKDPAFEAVRQALADCVSQHPDATVFTPLGLGHHRDHLLVFEAIEDIKKAAPHPMRVLYYEDYPYAATADIPARLRELRWPTQHMTVNIEDTIDQRVSMIKAYASQLNMLFTGPEDVAAEVRAYANRVGTNGKPRERFWTADTSDRGDHK